MNANQSIRVGAFFLLGVGLLWIVYETLSGGRLDNSNGYRITGTFTDIQQLKPTSEVRLAGVRIGTVVSTELDGTRAVVGMMIDKHYSIPADSEATVATAGMLGLNYVAIQPGKDSAMLTADSSIDTVQTADMGTVMAKLDSVGDRLEIVLSNAEVITGNIAEGKGTIGKLVNDPSAYTELMATVKDIQGAANRASTFIDNTNEVISYVRTGKGVLGTIVYDQDAAENLKVTVANVREFSTRLNNPDSSLGMFIDNDALYRQASNTLTKLDGALNSMNDAGPITAVGVLGSALF